MPLIPNEVVVYSRDSGIIYASYRDAPYDRIPRWEAGTAPEIHPTFEEWLEVRELVKQNALVRRQFDRLMMLYYTIKDTHTE